MMVMMTKHLELPFKTSTRHLTKTIRDHTRSFWESMVRESALMAVDIAKAVDILREEDIVKAAVQVSRSKILWEHQASESATL